MGDILPGIIGEVECHQGKLIQVFLPHVLPAVDDPRIMLQGLLLIRRYRDRYAGVLVGQLPGRLLALLRLRAIAQPVRSSEDVVRRTQYVTPLPANKVRGSVGIREAESKAARNPRKQTHPHAPHFFSSFISISLLQ